MSQPQTKSFMPAWMPALNKKVTNPIQGLWAPYLPPYLMVHHVGRKSGKQFKNPVVAFKRGDKLYVCLLYGSDSQWVKNVIAAGHFEGVRRGKRLQLERPEVVRSGNYEGPLPLATKALGKNLGVLIATVTQTT